MKTYGNIILMTVICIVLFWVFMALRPAQATFFAGPSGSCCNQFGGGGQIPQPQVSPRMTPRRYGTGRSYRQPSPHGNGHASGCDSLCQSKCQASWRALGFRSVNACVARWARLNAEGTAASCETAIKANGLRPVRGC